MPSLKISANAQKIAQYYIRLLAAPAVGSTYLVTVNGKTYTYTATTTTDTDEAASLVSDFNSQTSIPELQEVVASITSGANIKFASRTPGLPIDLSFNTGGAGAPTFASVSTQVNSSPSDISLGANWSGGALPAAADNVFVENLAIDLLYELDAMANTLTLFEVARSMSATIGLPEFVSNNRYREYRSPRYMTVKTATCNIGTGTGPSKGSNRIMIDHSTTAVKDNIYASGKGISGMPAVQLLGVNAANVLTATNSTVGIAINGDEVSTYLTVNLTDENGAVTFLSGPGLTLTNLNTYGNQVDAVLGLAPTNLSMQAVGRGTGGTVTIKAGNLTTCVVDAGTLIYQGVGAAITIGSVSNPLVIGEKGTLDLSEGDGTVTCANGLTVRAGAKIIDPRNRLTSTTITFQGCSPDEVTIIRGQGATLATA